MPKLPTSKYFTGLLIWNVVFALICIPTAGKMVDIFGIPLSISIFYFPFVYIIADLLTEVYGYAAARHVLWYTVITQTVATVIFQFVAYFPPAQTFAQDEAFRAVLTAAPQMTFFGMIAVFFGDISNNYVLAKMKILTGGRLMSLRFFASTVVGQTVNTAIFYIFGLWGFLNFDFIVQSVLLGSFCKVAVELVMLPVTVKVAARLKQAEKLDTFDNGTDFNPFKL